MEPFNLQAHLNNVYQTFPEAPHRPLIGITANYTDGDATLRDRYYQQVVQAGGTPVIIPPVADKEVIVNTLQHLDALLLSGGGDFNPLWAGEEPSPRLHAVNSARDLPELLITRLAYNRQLPILGICRGIQTLALALDGHVAQDIGEDYERNKAQQEAAPKDRQRLLRRSSETAPAAPPPAPLLKHSQEAAREEATHTVRIEKDSMLFSVYQSEQLCVNSFHHQAVNDPGRRFRTVATAPDGVIEAIESAEFKPIMGVQWHPEWLGEEGRGLFTWLVNQARNFYVAKRLHERVLTLDTHCDTPMFFAQGIHFEQRDPRILVDLHKMTEGRQDAVIMAAYLPQPKMGEAFSSKVSADFGLPDSPSVAGAPPLTPTRYADLIFDKIEHIVDHNRRYLSIARTPADLYEDKRKGRKSIMLAIENGLALGGDLQNLKHFAQRGVTYITLCHNGDNDLCDSARGCNTHGGVSPLGEKAIRQMNDLGIMVDLSHAAEKSFYDALDISRVPIVCSHSNCRSLCDHPRNLTDDQLRALARKGGVAHTTLYSGFLRQQGEATVVDAIAHLEHAIQVMGIDHVGLGTDFDGDGGVRGLADASELIQFTLHLLRRKYSEKDIQKIWGGNWLRVMALVQASRQ